jgi:hypothetical protein
MSFEDAAAYRRDKESDLFGQSPSDPCNDLFDQYLTFDSIDNAVGPSFPINEDSTFVVRSADPSQSIGTSSSDLVEETRPSNPQQPPADQWHLNNKIASSNPTDKRHTLFYNEQTGKAAVSDSDILSLEDIKLQSPQVQQTPLSPSQPPSSPSPVGPPSHRKNRFIDSITKTVRRAIRGSNSDDPQQRSPIRKASPSAKMMRASQYSQQDPEWAQRMTLDASKFNFEFPHQHGPLSPPPSARQSDASDCSNHMMAAMSEHQGMGYDTQLPPYYGTTRGSDYHSPLSTPLLTHDNDSRRASLHHQQSLDGIVYPTTPHHGQSSTPWAHTPSSTDHFDTFRSPNHFVTEAEAGPVWWSSAATGSIAAPSPSLFHNDGRQSSKSLAIQLQNELAYNASELACSPSSMPHGLMIQMPHSPGPQSYIIDASPIQAPSYFTQPSIPSPHTAFAPNSHQHSLSRHYSAPRLRKSRSSQSQCSSPSPKSMAATSFHVSKRRSSTRKASDIAPRIATAGSGMSGSVDFVNFTPSDSMKILTGVAPSGSSKTKARREKEAMEKRRRLSLAAVRAVRAAGGDVESLVEEGLFV